MTVPAATRKSTTHRGVVLRTEQLTPHMVRVVLGGNGLDAFDAGQYTDHYVKLLFPVPGTEGLDLSDVAAVRASLSRDRWPRSRTYSVRRWDSETRELSIDFVQHGSRGVAGPWAAAARPGQKLFFGGPGGGYAPDPDADWHLLAGDESALPAIAASLERLPAGARAKVFVEVDGPAEEQPLETAADADVVWLHRGAAPVGDLLVDRVTRLEFPAGSPHVFIHGEAAFVKTLRRYLRVDRALDRTRLSISGYWRRGMDEDGWQSSKSAWNADAEQQERLAAQARSGTGESLN